MRRIPPIRAVVDELKAIARELGALVQVLTPQRSRVLWHLGPVSHVGESVSTHRRRFSSPTRKVDVTMSLLDNQQVSFSISGVDEKGNPAPLTGTPAFAIDRPDILALVDNGDGTGVVSATGVLGTAVLSVVDTETDGSAFSGSVSIDVLPSGVTAVSIALGTPSHV